MAEFQLPPPANATDLENLVCDMFNEMNQTSSFKRFGKSGHRQKGIDILSTEKDIVVQCKVKDSTRKAILVKKELLEDIDKTVEIIVSHKPLIKFHTLYIVTTFSEHPDFDEYCESLKDQRKLDFNIVFWGWETIQRELVKLPKTIRAHYSSLIIQQHTKEQEVVNRLDMKRRIERDFADWINYAPENRKKRSRMIIHSIDDTAYPEHVLNREGQYQWFAAEIKGRTHKGVEFYTSVREIYVDSNFNWSEMPPTGNAAFTRVKAFHVSLIAFEDIVDYDLKGDGHYLCPHFFCKFRYGGTPYFERYYWQKDNIEFPFIFEEATRRKNK